MRERTFMVSWTSTTLLASLLLVGFTGCGSDDDDDRGTTGGAGGAEETGGRATGGEAETGGRATGGRATGGRATGGRATGGAEETGGTEETGGAGAGGEEVGGAGGVEPGGAGGDAGGARPGGAGGGEPGPGGAGGDDTGPGGFGGDAGGSAGAGGVCATEGKLVFEQVPVPVTEAEKRAVNASSWMELSCERSEIAFHTILRSGDDVNGTVFGQILDEGGSPVLAEDGSDFISNDNDFTSLLPVGDTLYSITHFESRPGAMYLTELEQDPSTGELTAVSTENIDFSAHGGLWVPCAGSVTPWHTHLGSEEYPPDARTIEEATTFADLGDSDGPYWAAMVRYWGLDPATVTIDDFRANLDPYQYGYAVEVTVDSSGDVTVEKHHAMGRVAVELAYVMPDQRTAYISDDGTNVGFYMFVADTAGDLSAGTLYAARWDQTSNANGGSADVTWIELGHATNAAIDTALAAGTVFSDIFETADPDPADDSCPDTYTSINTEVGRECLRVVTGMEQIASRLETRRYAAMLGATTEFRKEEGITFNPDDMKLYVAMSEVAKGMEDGSGNDVGGPNHIALPANKCGAVYEMEVGTDATIGSDYVAQNWAGLVVGVPIDTDPNNTCDLDGIANPDNLTFIPGHDTLIIGEDTGSGHQNDAIWAYNLTDGELTRIETTPFGSETTSPYFYPNIGGFAYLMSVVQHPYGESDTDMLEDASQAAAYVGYVGPMPALD